MLKSRRSIRRRTSNWGKKLKTKISKIKLTDIIQSKDKLEQRSFSKEGRYLLFSTEIAVSYQNRLKFDPGNGKIRVFGWKWVTGWRKSQISIHSKSFFSEWQISCCCCSCCRLTYLLNLLLKNKKQKTSEHLFHLLRNLLRFLRGMW